MGNRANFLPQNQVEPVKKDIKITRIVLVVDRSGSMSFCEKEVPKQVLKQFETIKKNEDGLVTVTLTDFGSFVSTRFENYTPDQALAYLYNYRLEGMTALTDSVMNAIKLLEKTEVKDSNQTEDWGYLVVVLTDGGENASSTPARVLAQEINNKQMTGHWTFAFMVPNNHTENIVRHYGALKENVTEWGATKQEYERVSGSTQMASINYLQQRSMGQTAVKAFYRTDLSNFDPNVSKLLQVTSQFKPYKVEKECDITSFYQMKTGLPYNKDDGRAFYQLTKKEIIQPNKEILIRDKSSKVVYGGDVRKALKMADGTSGVQMKVEPGNHANYDIFVQSKSPNRRLVRGTEVLVRK